MNREIWFAKCAILWNSHNKENIVDVLLLKFYHPTKQNKKFNLLLKHVKQTENDNAGIE
jgi:hypothetical protein